MKWIISTIELIVLIYYTFRVRKYSMQQINIKRESVLTTLSFILMEVIYLLFKIFFISSNDDVSAKAVFLIIAIRNLFTCLPIFFYSIL